jgi:hypothetical protein
MILIALALAAVSPPPPTDNFGERFPAYVPTDVRLFVIDAQACTHFSGEPYDDQDQDRKAFLQKMIVQTCTNIDKRKAALTRKYKSSAKIRKVISDAWEE